MPPVPAPLPIGAAFVRVLTLRFAAADLERLDRRHLYAGLIATWLAGVGRYWDNPRAALLQHLGLGSLVYVFVLAAFLWLIVKPLRPARWSYGHLLAFVTLTAPPALLYAIPVERWTTLDTARWINVWFLAVVALWRVALYGSYLRRWAALPWLGWVPALLLPLAIIVAALAALNLERAVFDVMAGLDEGGTAADGAYAVLLYVAVLAMLAVPVMLLAYGAAVLRARRRPFPRGPSAT